MKANYKILVYNFLILLFLNHGILYYLNPSDIYNYSNPIKYIKYIVIVILLILSIKDIKLNRLAYVAVIWISAFILYYVSMQVHQGWMVMLNYCIPLLTVLIYQDLKKYVQIEKCITITYIITSIMAYVEFFIMKSPFYQYADSGYRVCSIFINPNNFASIIWITTVYIIYKRDNVWIKALTLMNSCCMAILSGSRTGMLVIAIGIFLLVVNRIREINRNHWLVYRKRATELAQLYLVGMGALLCCSSIVIRFANKLLHGSRNVGSISLYVGRFGQYQEFLKNISDNPLFPNFSNYVYTDNLYLHIWGYFGLIVTFIFIVFNCSMIIKSYKQKYKICFLLLVLFFIYGMAENYLYLWPAGYIYWYIICCIFDKKPNLVKR